MLDNLKAGLFDLDGVICDTAKYHYLAWRKLANALGFDFSHEQNEGLKGVSRTESLEILLKIGKVTLSDTEKADWAKKKNDWYVDLIQGMDASELLPGSREYLEYLRSRGVKVALGSASKNAPTILNRLGITTLFDAIIDGNKVSKSKPDPEVFLLGAAAVGVAAEHCIVFEDAKAGIEAAKAAGMYAVGIGKPEELDRADVCVPNLGALLPR